MGRIRVLVCMRKFKGGPRIFRERLVQAMSKYDEVEIIHDEHQKFDIELVFLRKLVHHNKPKIIRVDGCYYEYGRLHQNDEIIKSIDEANCIIYQSEFSKKMCESILKVDKKNYIVHNGINSIYKLRNCCSIRACRTLPFPINIERPNVIAFQAIHYLK